MPQEGRADLTMQLRNMHVVHTWVSLALNTILFHKGRSVRYHAIVIRLDKKYVGSSSNIS